MASLLQCLLRTCFESKPEEEESEDSYEPPRSNRMIRFFQSATSDPAQQAASYRPAQSNDPTESVAATCCQNDSSEATEATACTTAADDNPHAASLRQFWRKFRERLEGASITTGGEEEASENAPLSRQRVAERERTPILKQACSFDSSKGVATILNDHIVLPGSDIQKQMAAAMAAELEEHDDECVICMEGFDPTNPRMPTRCGCGENRTYFHLPCLYQWIEQSKNCPSCRKRLQWEEF
jgi:transposase-like protein